jgi:hypothetical protein
MKNIKMLGPIDYVAIGFEGNKFDGSILSELIKATDSGAVRLVDLIFVIKDSEGNVEFAEIEDQHEDLKRVVSLLGLDKEMPLLTEEDVELVSGSLENNTSVALLVIEQLWAKGLKRALLDAGGHLVAQGRIHPDTVAAAVGELAAV